MSCDFVTKRVTSQAEDTGDNQGTGHSQSLTTCFSTDSFLVSSDHLYKEQCPTRQMSHVVDIPQWPGFAFDFCFISQLLEELYWPLPVRVSVGLDRGSYSGASIPSVFSHDFVSNCSFVIPIVELELGWTVPQETVRLRLKFREGRTFGGFCLRLIFTSSLGMK